MVSGGNNTTAPYPLTYSSVVSRYSVRIYLKFSTFNYLLVLACDIHNYYLTPKLREKIWTVAGPYFVPEQVKAMLVLRVLYGLNFSGAYFRNLLADQLHDLGYRSSISDPDICMRPAVNQVGSCNTSMNLAMLMM